MTCQSYKIERRFLFFVVVDISQQSQQKTVFAKHCETLFLFPYLFLSNRLTDIEDIIEDPVRKTWRVVNNEPQEA